jgi:hypothetical protein
MNNIITKNGVRYLICEPASFLRERYPVFNGTLANGRAFAVNLDTNKLVTIVAEDAKTNVLTYSLVVNYVSGKRATKILAKDWDVARVQIDDYLGDDTVKSAGFTISDASREAVYITTLERCKNTAEFYRQVRYAYANIR